MTRSPYFDMAELAEHLRYVDRETGRPDVERAIRWVRREKVNFKKRGRSLLVRKDDVEAALEPHSELEHAHE